MILAQHEGSSAVSSIRSRALVPAQLLETYLDGAEPSIGTLLPEGAQLFSINNQK